MGFAGEKDVNLTVRRPDPEPGSRAPGVLWLGAGPLCGALADAFGGKRP